MKGDTEARSQVNASLASAGLNAESLRAQTVAARLTDVSHIDALAMSAERRRNATLREVERHRAGFGRTLRKAALEIATEYEDVTTQPIAE